MRESRRGSRSRAANHHIATVRRFLDAINRADPDRLAGCMSAQHLLIDSLGARVRGRKAARRAWVGYFRMVPRYSIHIEGVLTHGSTVALLGTASGGYIPPGRSASVGRWKTPAAWRAVVRRSLLVEWQVYADNEPIRQLASKVS
jgi:ketosteroid isomerase-like protein